MPPQENDKRFPVLADERLCPLARAIFVELETTATPLHLSDKLKVLGQVVAAVIETQWIRQTERDRRGANPLLYFQVALEQTAIYARQAFKARPPA